MLEPWSPRNIWLLPTLWNSSWYYCCRNCHHHYRHHSHDHYYHNCCQRNCNTATANAASQRESSARTAMNGHRPATLLAELLCHDGHHHYRHHSHDRCCHYCRQRSCNSATANAATQRESSARIAMNGHGPATLLAKLLCHNCHHHCRHHSHDNCIPLTSPCFAIVSLTCPLLFHFFPLLSLSFPNLLLPSSLLFNLLLSSSTFSRLLLLSSTLLSHTSP